MNNIDKTMTEEMKLELEELLALESAGNLTSDKENKLFMLRAIDSAEKTAAQKSKDFDSAVAQKDHFRTKAEKAEVERKELEDKLNKANAGGGNGAKPALDVEDYIDISASLEGLDQREKEYLANQHKLTGKTLGEIRKDENFQLWQSAYQAKTEKERLALKPTNTQNESDAPSNFEQRLEKASTLAEKEALLKEAGLYIEPRNRSDRRNIGTQR